MAGSNIGMTYIRPCVTEDGKISAETNLIPSVEDRESSFGFLDSSKLCWLLSLSEVFSSIKCSEKLGIAKMEFAGKTIVVSKAGRINVRTAESKEDALETIWLVSRALWPAMICSKCSRAILECVSGMCDGCKSSDCSLLASGPPNPTRMFNDKWNKKTVSEIFSELKEDQSGAFHVISDLLQSVVRLFDDAISVFTSGSNPEDVEAAVRGRLDQTNRLAQRLIVQSRRQIEMSAGLVFLGIASNLEILGQALGSLSAFSLSDFDRKILKNSWSDLLGRYEAIWKHDPVSHRKRERPHSSFGTIYRRGRGRNIDFGKNLERMTEASRRFSRIADMTLAA